jgi:3-methyladenine DNA glycosylase AlkD
MSNQPPKVMGNKLSSAAVSCELREIASPEKAKFLSRYFKTGPGEYGEGDIFIGVTVPQSRTVARRFRGLPLAEAEALLHSRVHEERLTTLLILVDAYLHGGAGERQNTFDLYLANTKYINNWDLVDLTAPDIVGRQLQNGDRTLLLKLARSKSIWERRIAMLACFHFIYQGECQTAFEVIEILKNDSHDLIQKATGWMLREVGKRCGRDMLEAWLRDGGQYKRLPRTTLRYAIEKFEPAERQRYLKSEI